MNGHHVAYDDAGVGPPVVLIHGYGLCRKMWEHQREFFLSAGFRVITPDLRGFGDSEDSDGVSSISSWADDIIAFLDHLGIARAVFCGMSFGGYILFDLVDRYSCRVAGACFAMTKSFKDNNAEKIWRTAVAELFQRGEKESAIKALIMQEAGNKKSLKQMAVFSEVLGWMRNTSPAVLAGALLAMRDREDYAVKIQSYKRPVLIIGAELDNVVPPSNSRFLAKILPHATCEILPEVGHLANMEQPALFNRCLLEFLDNLKGGLAEWSC